MADPIKDLLEKFEIAKQLTTTSRTGKAGLIKAVIHDNSVKFYLPQLGLYFDTFTQAVQRSRDSAATGKYTTELSILDPIRVGQPQPQTSFGLDRSGSARQIFTDMLDRINDLDENDRNLLGRAGIDVDNLVDNGQMFVAKFELNNETIFGSEQRYQNASFDNRQTSQTLAREEVEGLLREAHSPGILGQGIQVLDDESSMRVIGFRYVRAGVMTHLNSYQANLLAAVANNAFFNPEIFDNIFGFDDDGSFGGIKAGTALDYAKNALKIAKRLKASFGERPISLSGNDLVTFLSNGLEEMTGQSAVAGNVANLLDHVLITDFEFDVIRNWAFSDSSDNITELRTIRSQSAQGRAEIALYEDLQSGNYVDSVIDFFTGRDQASRNMSTRSQTELFANTMSNEEVESVRQAIQDVIRRRDGGEYIQVYNQQTGKFGSDVLLDRLELKTDELGQQTGYFARDSKEYKLVKAMMESAELAKDGADVANAGFIRGQIRALDQSIHEVTNQINDMTDADQQIDKQLLNDELKKLKRLKSTFQNALDHGGQVTGRISVSGLTTAKNIVAVAEMEAAFNNIAFILNKTSFKKETAIAGARRGRVGSDVTEYINLSGIVSDYSENVRIDYAAAAAHGSLIATEEHYRAAEQRASILMSELNDAIESNILSPRVRSILDRIASSDPEELIDDSANEFAIRSAIKKREQALVIQKYVSMGGHLSDNPDIINALFDLVTKEIYRASKGDETKIVMANTYRFGIDTEAGLYGRTRHKNIAGHQQYQASDIFLGGRNGKAFGGEQFDIVFGESDRDVVRVSNEASQEVIKFRIADHKILLAEDAVAKYINALGGFDLDDKGIPVITRFRTTDSRGNVVQKLAFNAFRQPTGPEEIMFMLPNFDVHTVRSILRFDPHSPDDINDMSEIIRHFRNAYGSVEGSRFSHLLRGQRDETREIYRQRASSLRLLEQIMTGDGAIEIDGQNLYNYEENARLAQRVEQALLDVFEFAEARGLTTISEVSRRQARRIQDFGTASLRTYPGQGDVGYTTAGLFKLFDEAEAFDLSDTLEEVLETHRIHTGLTPDQVESIRQINEASLLQSRRDPSQTLSKFESKMQLLGDILDSRDGGNAIYSAIQSTVFGSNAARNIVAQQAGELGTYINTTMVVSSMMDQYQDFLHAAFQNLGADDFQTVYDQLLNFNIGMISQETAIDISINQGTSRTIAQQQTVAAFLGALEQSDYGHVNMQNAENAILQLIGDAYTDTTLEALNRQITPGIIRQTAYIRALSETLNLGDDFMPGYGFDRELFEARMLKGNPGGVIDFLNAYSQGLEAFGRDNYELTAAQQGLIGEIQQVVHAYNDAESGYERKNLVNQAMEILNRSETGFFMSQPREDIYGNVTRIKRASVQAERDTNIARTAALRRAYEAQLSKLNALSGNLPKAALIAAESVIEDYGEQLENFRRTRIRELADDELEKEILDRNKMFSALYDEIGRLSESSQMTKYELFTALDAQFMQKKIDLGNLQQSQSDAFNDVVEGIQRARTYRNYQDALEKDMGGIGESLFQKINATIDGTSGENFAERLQAFLDADETNVNRFNSLERDMINRFLKRDSEPFIRDLEHLREVARGTGDADSVRSGQAYLARNLIEQEDTVYGAFEASIHLEDDDFSDILEHGTKELEELNEVTPKRTPYKRITDKIHEREFLDIIQRPAVKKTLYGMAALIGFSFAYQGTQDRTAADMAGPPLLPGGSAYETSLDLDPVNIENVPYTGYNSGMSYQVSLHGDQDAINRFRESINDLDYGNYSTTMYNNLPRLGRDLYADAAPDF